MALGVPVLLTSGRTGAGLDAIARVRRRATARSPSSAPAGSASRRSINVLLGGDVQATIGGARRRQPRPAHHRRRRSCCGFPGEGWLIDTPGVRAVSLWLSGAGIERAFADVFDLMDHCRFRDCKHDQEPGCAVLAAIESGTLDPGAVREPRAPRRRGGGRSRRSNVARRSSRTAAATASADRLTVDATMTSSIGRPATVRSTHGLRLLRPLPRVPRAAARLHGRVDLPQRAVHEEQIDESGDPHFHPPIMEELKAEARERGLWNLFQPHAGVLGRGLQQRSSTRRSPRSWAAARSPSEACNCSAPDTGNMEVLTMFGTPEQQDIWLRPLLEGEIRSAFAMTEPDVAS